MNSFKKMGLIGLAICLAVNIAALLLFKRPGAVFFSESWWSVWYPNYLVWSVFVVIGFARRKRA